MNSDKLQAIKFDETKNSLAILDQLLIPYFTYYIDIHGISDAYDAIKSMQVRGAPAIAIVGIFSVVVELSEGYVKQDKDLSTGRLLSLLDYLESSRPTAINLHNACSDIRSMLDNLDPKEEIQKPKFEEIKRYAMDLYSNDLSNNYKLGENGFDYIEKTLKEQNFKGPFSICTICNTGSLATSGYGTALGIIRKVSEKLNKESGNEFWLEHVYPCETRPYNQGARLTTFELKYDGIPFTLICDNMFSSLVNRNRKAENKFPPVKFVIVGADRIVANGDTANKIGTFQLATITKYFNSLSDNALTTIKFIVAAPRTTLHLNAKSGDDIKIEERPAEELTTIRGPVIENNEIGEKKTIGIATPGINVWNPAFDVTPHHLIDAIVTENAVHEKDARNNINLQ